MLDQFKKHLKTHFSHLLSDRFILACSGGVDSVVLTHLCHASQLNFLIAHCNFQLRGKDSDSDEVFVCELAKKIEVEIYVNHFDTENYISKNKVNIQVAARELRYAWFAELMEETSIETIVTAHHADDNVETFLINLSRGTGIAGLTGIPDKTNTISRPLLPFSREQILSYAKAEKLEWVEDRSNAETKYIRNKIRHEIVPVLKEVHPKFLHNFEKTISYLTESDQMLQNHIRQLKSSLFETTKNGFRIAVVDLEELHPQKGYLHALFKAYGFTAWDDIQQLFKGLSGKEVRSKTHRLVKHRKYLLLEEISKEQLQHILITSETDEIKAPIHLKVERVDAIGETSITTLYVDEALLQFPLKLRKWEKGDYFYPFGMNGKKKLSKYFKDEKIDVLSKEKQWLLYSQNKLVWVVGRRSDKRFSVTEKTQKIVKIQFYE